MARSQKKLKLYELGRTVLGRLVGREVPGYVCPICLRGFENLDDLSEEHVPPQSIGGEVLCLTCLQCNCGAGHTIEAEMHRERMARSFLTVDGQPRRAKIVVGGHEARIDLHRDENGFHMDVLGGQNDPKAVEALKVALKGVLEAQGTFNLRDSVSYSRRNADTGFLKSAYLAAFAKLGYTYILKPALNRVRQIQEPSCRVLDTVRVYCGKSGSTEQTFLLLHEPVRCMAVKITDSVICLPLLDGDDSFYETLAQLRKDRRQMEWRGNGTIRWPDRFELALDVDVQAEN